MGKFIYNHVQSQSCTHVPQCTSVKPKYKVHYIPFQICIYPAPGSIISNYCNSYLEEEAENGESRLFTRGNRFLGIPELGIVVDHVHLHRESGISQNFVRVTIPRERRERRSLRKRFKRRVCVLSSGYVPMEKI